MNPRFLSTLLVLSFATSLLLWNLGNARTLSFHEALVAAGTREMLASGDWLVPRVGGEPWLEKPPLPQWLVALVVAIGGSAEPGFIRLPSVLAGLLGVYWLFDLVRSQRGEAIALIAALLQSSTVYFLTYARLAEADIFLWAMVVGAFRLLARHFLGSPGRFDRPLFFLLLGLTQLVKGPLFGAVLILTPTLAFLLSLRRLTWLMSLPGILLALAVGLAWPTAILLLYPETAELWAMHTLGRLQTRTTINPEPWWYYATTLPWQLLPWSVLALPALPRSWRWAVRRPASLDRLMWLWFLVPTVVLSIPAGKHHHYLMHALPPFALWAAQGLFAWRRGLAWLARRPLLLVVLALLLLGAIMSAGPLVERELGTLAGQQVTVMACAGLVGLLGLAYLARLRRVRYFLLGLSACAWLGSAWIHSQWMPNTDNYREETALMERFTALTPVDTSLAVMGMNPCRALYYTDRRVHDLPTLEDLHRLLATERRVHLLTFAKWESILAQVGQVIVLERTPESDYAFWVRRPALGLYVVSLP